jgi:predicted amidohydrolase
MPARPVTIAVINVSNAIVPIAERRQRLLDDIAEAGRRGANIVLLPEMADHSRTVEALAAYAKGPAEVRRVCEHTLDAPWMRAVRDLAAKHRMVVIPNVLLKDGGYFNSAVVIGPVGAILGQYRKTHLAPGEELYFEAGKELRPIATPFGSLGIFICYDRCFPEVARCHELQGAEILLWTTMRQVESEEILYRAILPATAAIHGLPYAVATYVRPEQVIGRDTMAGVVYNAFGGVVAGGSMVAGPVVGTVDLSIRPVERRTWDEPDWVDSPRYLRRQRHPELYGAIAAPIPAAERDLRQEPTLIARMPTQIQ